MKKIKAVLVSLLLLAAAPLAADDFDWSQCWCNYGADIKPGDMMLSLDTSFGWDYFDAFNSGGWSTPFILADFQVAVPVWKLPFSFGGYVGTSWYNYHEKNEAYNHHVIQTGGSITYHVKMPVKELDLYTGIKTGFNIDRSSYYNNGVYVKPEFGYNVGASWYYNKNVGCNMEFGYPASKIGVVFKF